MWARLKCSGLALWQSARRAAARRKSVTARSLLLLRLENAEIVGKHLGIAGFGHLQIDMTMRLSRVIRPEDPVRIVATGCFAVALSNRSESDAMRIALRLQACAQEPVSISGVAVAPVLSGVLIHTEGAECPGIEQLTRNAHARLDDLPKDRLGSVVLFDHDPRLSAPDLCASVAEAAAAGQILAYFQPQISCHSGEVTGFEALARWNHPTRGILPPGAFMSGMSDADHHALTLSMLRQSIAALKSWDAAGWRVPTVSVNISNCELSDPGFAANLIWELDRQDIRPDRLALEVLESVAPVTSSVEARNNLALLAKAGCRLDLDDFGTGFASLDAIRQFSVHRIKIDRSFVMGCDIDASQQRMILAILALAERLGIAALAEGVESREEHTFLAQMGCDEVQGYAIARPMPLAATRDFLQGHARNASSLPTVTRRSAG